MAKVLARQPGPADVLAQQQHLEALAHLAGQDQRLQRALLARRLQVDGERRRQRREHAQKVLPLRREPADFESRRRRCVGARAEIDPRA